MNFYKSPLKYITQVQVHITYSGIKIFCPILFQLCCFPFHFHSNFVSAEAIVFKSTAGGGTKALRDIG